MKKDEEIILKKILEINQYILRKSIKIIDDTFKIHKPDFKKIKIEYCEHDLKGLWRYYILEKYDKLEFQYDNRVLDVHTITVEDNFGEVVEISRPELGWEEFDYYYCLLRIDRSFYNPVVSENFINWLNHIIIGNNIMARWNVDNLIQIASLVEYGNKIIELFENLKIDNYIKGVSEINKELIKSKKSVNSNEKLLDKTQKKYERLEKKLFDIKPETNKIEDLVKYYITIAISIERLPSIELLAKLKLSKASWHKKLWDSVFLGMLLKNVMAKLKNKRIKKTNMATYESIQNFILDRVDDMKNHNSKNAGSTLKSKPDYNDNISDDY